jgi:hypothetical protein
MDPRLAEFRADEAAGLAATRPGAVRKAGEARAFRSHRAAFPGCARSD